MCNQIPKLKPTIQKIYGSKSVLTCNMTRIQKFRNLIKDSIKLELILNQIELSEALSNCPDRWNESLSA